MARESGTSDKVATLEDMDAWLSLQPSRDTRRANDAYAREYVDFCIDCDLKGELGDTCALYLYWGWTAAGRTSATVCGAMSDGVRSIYQYSDHSPSRHKLCDTVRAATIRYTHGVPWHQISIKE